MSKFKKGDKVRVLHTDYKQIPVGSVTHVVSAYAGGAADLWCKEFPEGLHFYPHELELEPVAVATSNSNAKFKVGDRVKTNGGYAFDPAFGTVKQVRVLGLISVVLDAIPAGERKATWLYHPEELEPAIRIEAGKFYKTHDGRKVGPMRLSSTVDGWTADGGSRIYKDNGERIFGDQEHTWLIAEWVDEPAAEQPVVAASAGNDNAKPKFKVGDRVRYVDSQFGEATVVAITSFGIQVDTGGKYGICTEQPHSIELIAPANTIAIVALIENGQPLPSHHPHVHPNEDAATTEASRLAKKHPGKAFGVYELVHTAEEAVVYEHEWQRLAAEGRKIEAADALMRASGLDRRAANTAILGWLEEAA